MQLQLAAANVLKLVIDEKRSLDHALEQYLDEVENNRARLQEISYGACRFYSYFDAILAELLKKPLKSKDRIVHFILICALYQIEHMRTPDHATVNQSVKALAKTRQSWAGNLTNGVLRNYLRSRDEIINSISNVAVKQAFPSLWVAPLKKSWPDDYERILAASNIKPPMTLRINQQAIARKSYASVLHEADIEFSLTEHSSTGITLKQPLPVEKIPGFNEGQVSVQDESAQLVPPLLKLEAGQRVLDGCAAPGGKTCAVLEQQPELKSIVAVDLQKRIAGIEQNLQRLKLNAEVVAADLADLDQWWDGRPFERILLDVPCSGSGVIRRHPDIKHRREPADFIRFAEQQVRLLSAAWQTLVPGGLLLYVTCSVLRSENDGVIGQFIEEYNDAVIDPLDEELGLETKFGRQRLPGIHSGDGFYFCRIKKLSEQGG